MTKSRSEIIAKTLILYVLVTLVSADSSNNGGGWFAKKNKRYQAEEVIGKSPQELIELRGFQTEVHYVRTHDGYHIQAVRMINPEVSAHELKRPVVFNHGLIETATIWLLNTFNVKPLPVEDVCAKPQIKNETIFYKNTAMMLANAGYDVWLMSMRGTDYSLGHDRMSPKEEQFWNYCLDDFALTDVPSVVDYVKRYTKARRVGYIGHSQATFSIFGLLAVRPHYADIIEPAIAVAPVAFIDHTTSLARPAMVAATASSKNLHGPWPPMSKTIRGTLIQTCAKARRTSAVKSACDFIEMLIGGKGEKWLKGYYAHMPFYSSLKVLRQFGQLIKSKRFCMYDYGSEENMRLYGQKTNPDYPVGDIKSKSLILIYTKSDSLAELADVEHFKRQLNVPLLKDVFINEEINHFDMLIDSTQARRVSIPVLEALEALEHESGVCSASHGNSSHQNDDEFGHGGIEGEGHHDPDLGTHAAI